VKKEGFFAVYPWLLFIAIILYCKSLKKKFKMNI
jgi:hypothetical protein